MTTPIANPAGAGIAGVAGAGGATGIAGVQLPNAGTGGAATPSTSIIFLAVAGLVASASALVLALLGRQRDVEDDGISVT